MDDQEPLYFMLTKGLIAKVKAKENVHECLLGVLSLLRCARRCAA